MISTGIIAALPLLLASLVGVVDATACNVTTPCPSSAPCCSEFGFCGTDNFCLGGCNPFASQALDSCRPEPMCKDATYTFADQSRILTNATFFDGNATEYDWVLDKGNILNSNGDLALILTETNGGTRISSTRYVHYGQITAKIKAGRWDGVVTAFITMSDVKDEIDWEFPGPNVTEGQSNYFWQGVIPTPTKGGFHEVSTDRSNNYHEYGINWQPDTLEWLVDGQVVRTLKKSDTIVNGVANFPTTPSRVQLSIWPAGISSSPPGTVEWAGGMINWQDPDYVSSSHFYALVNEISIKCQGTQSVPANSDLVSYVYGGNRSDPEPTIIYSNHSTLLNAASGRFGSFTGTGSVLAGIAMATVLSINALLL